MSKATPGPWTAHWSKYSEGTFIVQAGMPSNRVLARFDGDGDGPDEQEIADARLIAAAPDLLAALKQVEAEMRAGFGSSFGETREQVRRAIAKAEASHA